MFANSTSRVAAGLALALALAGSVSWVATIAIAKAQETVVILSEDCRRLTRHVPAADVAYTPGVDVYGRKVAPAEVNGGSRIELPTTFTFVLEFQPLEDEEELDQTTLALGAVMVDENGEVFFNGRPIDDDSEAELARLCAEALSRGY